MAVTGKEHANIIEALAKNGVDFSKVTKVAATYKTLQVNAGDFYYDELVPVLDIVIQDNTNKE